MRSQFRLDLKMGSLKAAHGGGLRAGKRKTRRPFVPRRPMHVVLRASCARKELSMLQPQHDRKITGILRAQAKKHFVQLQEFVNVGNHLHIKVKANTRESFQAFLISTTALIARAVTGARRGRAFGGAPSPGHAFHGAPNPDRAFRGAPIAGNAFRGDPGPGTGEQPFRRKFWDALAFSRVVSTKFEEQILDRYFTANIYERQMGKDVRDIFLGKVNLVPS